MTTATKKTVMNEIFPSNVKLMKDGTNYALLNLNKKEILKERMNELFILILTC